MDCVKMSGTPASPSRTSKTKRGAVGRRAPARGRRPRGCGDALEIGAALCNGRWG